jgi:hypothetical protein
MSVLLDIVFDKVKAEYSKEAPKWTVAPLVLEDIHFLVDESHNFSEFDPRDKRKEMVNKMIKRDVPVVVMKCKYGQVFMVLENKSQFQDIPMELWARIMRMYFKDGDKPFKVFFLANTNIRKFPKKLSEHIGPTNINGGYTYRCNRETILIYRAEDATRVLIHELQHSCCCDDPENGVDIVEAETEAWAELIWVALLSEGKRNLFDEYVKRQSEWMIKQNEKVRQHMKHPDSMEFPWRYTIGKEEVWKRWGILQCSKPQFFKNVNSLRLTFPPSYETKKKMNVESSSTIL